MPPSNPYEPPGAPIALTRRTVDPPSAWEMFQVLSVVTLACGVPLNLVAMSLAWMIWYVQARAGYQEPYHSRGFGVGAVYLSATAGIGGVAAWACWAGRWRLAVGTTAGFALLFSVPIMIPLWILFRMVLTT